MQDAKIIPVLKTLSEKGWIPLTSLGILLGYKHGSQIYQSKRVMDSIDSIKVGRVNRVYEDAVISALENTPRYKADALMCISMYTTIKRTYIPGVI